MKRFLMFLLTGLLLLSMCACASSGENATEGTKTDKAISETAAPSVENETESNAESEEILIGVEFFDWSIDLGKDIKSMIEYASEAIGATPMYAENKFDSEKCITDVENLFAAGCKAVIVCNTNDAQMVKIVQVAEKYDGKVFQFFRTLNDEEIRDQIWNSTAYGGQVHEDEYDVGYHVAKQMIDAGVTNVGLINFTVGDITAETRQAGFVAAFEEAGTNIVAETWEVTT